MGRTNTPRGLGALALALVIGFLSYRVALAVIASDLHAGPATSICPATGTRQPRFEALTGLPEGWEISCPNIDGLIQYSPDLVGRWQRSLPFGLAGAGLTLIGLWWHGRRRRGLRQPNEAMRSA